MNETYQERSYYVVETKFATLGEIVESWPKYDTPDDAKEELKSFNNYKLYHVVVKATMLEDQNAKSL